MPDTIRSTRRLSNDAWRSNTPMYTAGSPCLWRDARTAFGESPVSLRNVSTAIRSSSEISSAKTSGILELQTNDSSESIVHVCGSGSTSGAAAAVAAVAVPVLVALNGDATGPGMEMALAGDLRICVPSARFGFPGLARGVLPQDGGTQRLPRLVGPAWAKDMLFTGRMVDAAEALSIGLVNRVVEEPGGLRAAAAELAAQITGGSPLGARYVKEAVTKGMDLSLDQGLGLEADLNVILQSTADRAEGIKSFFEKRPPDFKGS